MEIYRKVIIKPVDWYLLPVEQEQKEVSAEDYVDRLYSLSFEFKDSDGIKHSPWITRDDAVRVIREYAQFSSKQRQVTFEEIKAEANRLYPICKPRNYVQEGQWFGFVKCGTWYSEQIKTK